MIPWAIIPYSCSFWESAKSHSCLIKTVGVGVRVGSGIDVGVGLILGVGLGVGVNVVVGVASLSSKISSLISQVIFSFSSSYGESAKSNFSHLISTEVEFWIGVASLLSKDSCLISGLMSCSCIIGAPSKSILFSLILAVEGSWNLALCFFKPWPCENLEWQTSHSKGFTPSWVERICFFIPCLFMNLAAQMGQQYAGGFFSSWINSMCRLMLYLFVKLFLQSTHS